MAEVTRPELVSVKARHGSEVIAFQSSFLQSAEYNPNQQQLTLAFKSGHTEIYTEFYPTMWAAWKEHPSKGSFYARNVKGKFDAVSLKKPLFVSDFDMAFKMPKKRGH